MNNNQLVDTQIEIQTNIFCTKIVSKILVCISISIQTQKTIINTYHAYCVIIMLQKYKRATYLLRYLAVLNFKFEYFGFREKVVETTLSDTQQNMFPEQHHVSLGERVDLQVETHTIRESANKHPTVVTVELMRSTFLNNLI